MSTSTYILIALVAVFVLAALAFVTLARRSDVRGAGDLSAETQKRDAAARRRAAEDGETATASTSSAAVENAAQLARITTTPGEVAVAAETGLTPWTPPDREQIDTSRREFFNRAIIGLMGASLGTFAAGAFVAFLWPTATGGFGGKVPLGKIDDIRSGIRDGFGFFYAPEARAWITEYPATALKKAEAVYEPLMLVGIQQGLIASYQKCPHLGCRVPQCVSSKWFECGCHGSQYNQVGEKKGGPAPRGMDHFPLEFSPSGDVTVDTGVIIPGQPIGVNTTGQEAEGPHCVGAAEH